MKIPKSVKIGWRTYDVEFITPDTLEAQTNAARVHHENEKIYIANNLLDDEKVCAFLHELMHCLFWQAGKVEHEDEWIVKCLENGLMSLLKDNPSLFSE